MNNVNIKQKTSPKNTARQLLVITHTKTSVLNTKLNTTYRRGETNVKEKNSTRQTRKTINWSETFRTKSEEEMKEKNENKTTHIKSHMIEACVNRKTMNKKNNKKTSDVYSFVTITYTEAMAYLTDICIAVSVL